MKNEKNHESVTGFYLNTHTIVADTGDIDSIAKIHPQDATTNRFSYS